MAKLRPSFNFSGILAQGRHYLRQDSGRYYLLALIRILLVLFPQTAYLHRDEYFESFEDGAGDALGVDSARRWGINSDGIPNRHVTFPVVMITGPLIGLNILSNFWQCIYTTSMGLVTPYTSLVAPRLLACLLSFMTDYYMIRLFTLISPKKSSTGHQASRRLLLLASSGALMIYATRTFNCVIEMSIYTALVYQVARAITPLRQRILMQKTDKVKIVSVPKGDLATVVPVALLVACGCYNRSGFILYAIFPVFAWMLRTHSGIERRSSSAAMALAKRAISLAMTAAPGILFLASMDNMYYGSPGPAEDKMAIGNEPPANEASPPWRVLRNILVLYNILGITAVCRSIGVGLSVVLRRPYFIGRRLQAFLTWCSGGPLLLMTFLAPFGATVMDHQFLLPMLPIFILLNADVFDSGDKTHDSQMADLNKMPIEPIASLKRQRLGLSRILFRIWIVCNILFVLYYGFLKDAGTYKFINRVHNEISLGGSRQIYICTCQVPSIPISLLGLPKEPRDPEEVLAENGSSGGQRRVRYGRRVYMNELGNSTIQELHRRVVALLDMCRLRYGPLERKCIIMVAIPGTMSEEYESLVTRRRKRDGVKLLNDSEFFPHVSPSAPSTWIEILGPDSFRQLSLMVYIAQRTNG